jgi:hypothetical protein
MDSKTTMRMIKQNYRITLFILFLIVVFSPNIFAQSETETVVFKVRTSSPGGNFSPRNIGAIWIEDSSGDFVKTIKLWANRRKQYLYTWNSSSGGNTIDAATGATLSSHQTHEVTWDLKDVHGNNVSDGNYKLKIEMTDEHSQGPLASFDFPVGEPPGALMPPDETYFHDIELIWNSKVTYVRNDIGTPSNYQLYQNYPNPFNPTTEIKYSLSANSKIELSVYNSSGQKVSTLVNQYQRAGTYTVEFNASDLTSGLYFYKIISEYFTQTRKMLLIK